MKTCCCCMDVRIGTIVLGFCHLYCYALLLYISGFEICTYESYASINFLQTIRFLIFNLSFVADNSVALAIAFCSFVITALLIYGSITRQPSYLLPFFCLQVFDFCVNLLGAVGAISYIPQLKLMLKNNPNFPYRGDVDRLDMHSLMFTVVMVCLIVLLVKAYLIACVWSCYKTLVNYRINQATQIFTYDVNGEPNEDHALLPNYEDAIKDSAKDTPPPYTAN
ncbi:predicted protein [Nematostella vectensis]|uniref:Lysosomal-associated transmembrane protein 4A n=1 Tax=Nematostella vectensis TaxID=45351 RepID=A7SFY8_NEMVE|nr:predicted protein [Nematostella vectensis]|eukprot:XP_001629430.1 predicted protein [Nematostella vectensis]